MVYLSINLRGSHWQRLRFVTPVLFSIIVWRWQNKGLWLPLCLIISCFCCCSVTELCPTLWNTFSACMLSQSCPTLYDPMGCSPPDSSVHGILQARILEMGCHFLLQVIFPTQGLKLSLLWLLHCRRILYAWASWQALVSPSFLICILNCSVWTHHIKSALCLNLSYNEKKKWKKTENKWTENQEITIQRTSRKD